MPTLLGSLATAENELMVAAIVHTTKDSRAESSTLDDCPPHAKRAHHEIPFAQLSLEQLAALIRQQLLRRLPMDPHGNSSVHTVLTIKPTALAVTGPLSSFTAFYQQLQLMRSSGMVSCACTYRSFSPQCCWMPTAGLHYGRRCPHFPS